MDSNFFGADLTKAVLRRAAGAADFSVANLSGADLSGANLQLTYFNKANLQGAYLQAAMLIGTDFSGADLTGCHIFGVSAWGLNLDGAKQQNLVITPWNEPTVTVDNIEVAQFIYLMLHNQKVRDVIDTITSKAVLILGRFTDERKAVLDALRDELPLVVGSTLAQAQGVEIGPGGIRVDPDRRDRDYYRDRRDYRGGRRCRTEYTTRESPSGRMVREKKTVCRD